MRLKEAAGFFKPDPIRTQPERCLNPRHRLIYCDICTKSCPQQAIIISSNGVEIDVLLCNHCGLCVSDCPTDVFRHEYFDAAKLVEQTRSKKDIDIGCQLATEPNIPCHGMLSEALLAALYGNGVERIHLYGLENCESCATRTGKHRIDAVKQYARCKIPSLLMQKTDRSGNQNSSLKGPDATKRRPDHPPLARRQFLATLGRKSAAMVMPAAVKQLIERNTEQDHTMDIGSDEEMLMRKHIPTFHRLSLMALFSERDTGNVFVRFHEITATDSCTGCQICAVRCPTGALIWSEQGDEVGLEYHALSCIGCGLCISICPCDALSMRAQQDSKALCHDRRRVLFYSQQLICANCGERFLAGDNNRYCLACRHEINIKKQWAGFRVTGPKDR